jgi:hypothetical protein
VAPLDDDVVLLVVVLLVTLLTAGRIDELANGDATLGTTTASTFSTFFLIFPTTLSLVMDSVDSGFDS